MDDTWVKRYESVSNAIENEKWELVGLIIEKSKELLKTSDFIQVDGSVYAIGLDCHGEQIVAWGDGYHVDLIDIKLDELLVIVDNLRFENYSLE